MNLLLEKVFTENYLPVRPLASNDLAAGVYRTSKENALNMKFIETTPKTYSNLIVLDIDHEDANRKIKSLAWDDEAIPVPNYIATNELSGHAHVGWILSSPVGTQKGQAYFKHVRSLLEAGTGADQAYGGRITRNPLKHHTEVLSEDLYTLAALEQGCKNKVVKKRYVKAGEDVINGRNDYLFHSLRRYSYESYRACGYQEQELYTRLTLRALELNLSSFEKQLSEREVEGIVRSIVRWTTENHSAAQFSKIQSARSRKRWGNTEEKKAMIRDMVAEGHSARVVADTLGMSLEGARKAIQRLK